MARTVTKQVLGRKMLTTEEVAERLNMHMKTVQLWLRQGRIKGTKLGPRMWRVRESDLQDFIEQGMNQTDEQ